MTTPAQELRALTAKQGKSKYRARKAKVDGITFDSQAEARKYGELNLLVAAGELSGFDCQVPFPLIVNGELVTTYVADFVCYYPDGSQKVIDVKGYKRKGAWDIFRIKQKLMKATRDIEVIVEP